MQKHNPLFTSSEFKEYESVCCAVCQKTDVYNVPTVGELSLPLSIVICRNCGLVFQSPRWKKQGFKIYYSEVYDRMVGRVKDDKLIKVQKTDEAEKIYKRLNQSIKFSKVSRFLDIGCGKGDILLYLANAWNLKDKIELLGIEASNVCLDYLNSHKEITVINKDMNSRWEKEYQESLDVVIMRHVLEHSLNPVELLTKVCSTLSPSGFIYVAVPDMMHFKPPLWGGWFMIPHTYYFSKKTLLNVSSASGFQPEYIEESFREGEVWALFRKECSKVKFRSVYMEQKRLIDQQICIELKKDKYKSIIRKQFKLLRKLIKYIVPYKMRSHVRRNLGYY